MLRVLAISGSLRAASSNSAILRMANRVAPADLEIVLFDGISGLPYFNPDLDREMDDPRLPPSVVAMRRELRASRALLISSPEYAHGVPGVLKNALDWLVGGPEMVGMPCMLLATSSHSVHAPASLAEILRTMSARVLQPAPIELPRSAGPLDEEALADSDDVGGALRAALASLRTEILR